MSFRAAKNHRAFLFVLFLGCFAGASSKGFFERREIAAFFISRYPLLLGRFWFPLFSVRSVPPWQIFFSGNQSVLRGFFAVEDGAAGAAHGDSVLDFFRADRTIGQGAGVIQ